MILFGSLIGGITSDGHSMAVALTQCFVSHIRRVRVIPLRSICTVSSVKELNLTYTGKDALLQTTV